jgi:tyrosyl-tRNA synthetase
MTIMVHGKEALDAALNASQILFGKGTTETLRQMDEKLFLSVFDGVPTFNVPAADLAAGIPVSKLLTDIAPVFPSKSELRRGIAGLQINKEKVATPDDVVNASALLNGKYILVQKGKKNFYILVCA